MIKRFWKKIKSFFTGPEKAEHIGYFVGMVTWIILSITIISIADKTPASEADFKELESEIIAIQENPILVFKTDCEVDVEDEIITVNLENKECSLTVEFDSNFEIISTEKFDLAEKWWIPVIFFCLISFTLAYYLSEGVIRIVTIIEDVSTSIKKRKKLKESE